MKDFDEQDKRQKLTALMADWKNECAKNSDNNCSPDGFFPGYFKQRPKVLFIGSVEKHDGIMKKEMGTL